MVLLIAAQYIPHRRGRFCHSRAPACRAAGAGRRVGRARGIPDCAGAAGKGPGFFVRRPRARMTNQRIRQERNCHYDMQRSISHNSRPLGGGCRRMTPGKGIAGQPHPAALQRLEVPPHTCWRNQQASIDCFDWRFILCRFPFSPQHPSTHLLPHNPPEGRP